MKYKTITLDWDSIAWCEAKEIMDFIIKDNIHVMKIKIVGSPRADGYHVYLTMDKRYDLDKCLYWRNRYRDDGKRVVMDKLLKTKEESKMIIFSYKNKMKGGIMREQESKESLYFVRN